jgi:putative PIN family toxin of toxin-antitoxin system
LIVFDCSTLVGAVLKEQSTPDRAFVHAARTDQLALSIAVMDEILEVLFRPKLARIVTPTRRDEVIRVLRQRATWFVPSTPVVVCRDPSDDKYLTLALESQASTIVSSDQDLLVLNPWRTIRIVNPADYLESIPRT